MKANFFYYSKRSNFTQLTTRKIKRFYKEVGIREIINPTIHKKTILESNKILNPEIINCFSNQSHLNEKYYKITLDGKNLKTLYLQELNLPNKLLALAVLDEWQYQKEYINYYSMHIVY